MSTNPPATTTTTSNDEDPSSFLPPYHHNNPATLTTTTTNITPMDLTTRMPLPLNAGEIPIDCASSEPINISMIDVMPPQLTNALIGSPPGPGGNLLTGTGGSFSLMQSSPPPHSYRHSRAYRHFKNPPQPHMCIRTTTESGEELFINVLSWTRIVIPQEPSDPIPLYGGMRVPPGSPRSPPIVFAVMANPEVLKDSGRHSKDPEERRAMVELMCDFVEAMNPGVKLVRNAVILKDRDISGELKDVWNAVQAQRDREREEQMMQQRQQQHYHNITTQQMFPKAQEALSAAMHEQQQQQFYDGEGAQAIGVVERENVASGAPTTSTMMPQIDNRATTETQQQQQLVNITEHNVSGNSNNSNNNNNDTNNSLDTTDHAANRGNKSAENASGGENIRNGTALSTQQNGFEHKDPTEVVPSNQKQPTKDESKVKCSKSNSKATQNNTNASQHSKKDNSHNSTTTITTTTNTANTAGQSKRATTPTSPTLPISANASTATTSTSSSATANNASTATTTTTTTKKDKLGGFLPNGCIFPRFKNNKHKDKDKDKEKEKEKEPKTKDKEKTLLNALKKSKDKKVAPIEQPEKAATDSDAKTQYEKNCINLENEVQKLDLNKIDIASNNDSMFIKLKVTNNSSAAAK